MTDLVSQAETASQSDSKKVSVQSLSTDPVATISPGGSTVATQRNDTSTVHTTAEASSTASTAKSNNTTKAAAAITTKTSETSAPTSAPSNVKQFTHPVPKKGAPVLPPVPMHHPYAHHHYYAYHQHMAAASSKSTDPKKSGIAVKQPNSKSAGKQGAGATGQPPPPPIYPPPPPHLAQHHHAYQAWAAYRYAQQHSQYHGGPPPPGPPPPWNADAYAAAHQAYAAAASKTAATAAKKGNTKKGSSAESGTAATAPVGSASAPSLPPHHHYPSHSGSVPQPPAGPYRYSDPTLRRDAMTRISGGSDKIKNHLNATAASKSNSPSSSLPPHTGLASGSPPAPVSSAVGKNGIVGGPVMVGANRTPPDPATLHMLELEARAEGATSPSQIEDFHREEVTTMGCTCKKTKCLKLYCQCFAVKIYCGSNCRCLNCHNSAEHESERQNAIRSILSRNPTAFDTKFQKNNRKIPSSMVVPGALVAHSGTNSTTSSSGGVVHGRLSAMDIPHARTISHKVGCKCRKSACVKKYCECYAGNVKCSINCRCVGCKNMPPGGFGPRPEESDADATSTVKTTPTKNMMSTPVKKEPSWMMSAAQNLTFLKHGSAEKPRRIISRVPSESGSMPSLESSSEESPLGAGHKIRSKAGAVSGTTNIPEPSTAERAAVDALQSSEKTAVSALLMAAMAMTEMSGDNVGNTDRENRQDTVASSPTTTSPVNNRENNNYNNSSPDATNRSDDDRFETPQRNLLKKFMSPKRKVSDRNEEEICSIADKNPNVPAGASHLPSRNLASSDAYSDSEYGDDDSPKREHPGDGTPSLLQKVKRSRLGSLKKGGRLLEREKSNGVERLLEASSATSGIIPMEMSTPAKSTGGTKIADLTPVSARCIDFKKMCVNDSNNDPAVVDSVN